MTSLASPCRTKLYEMRRQMTHQVTSAPPRGRSGCKTRAFRNKQVLATMSHDVPLLRFVSNTYRCAGTLCRDALLRNMPRIRQVIGHCSRYQDWVFVTSRRTLSSSRTRMNARRSSQYIVTSQQIQHSTRDKGSNKHSRCWQALATHHRRGGSKCGVNMIASFSCTVGN
jgi:hypothetical protein